MKSAKELLGFDHFDANIFARRAPQPIGIPQKSLEILEEIIEKHGNKGHEPPAREDLRQIYLLFIETPPRQLSAEFDTFRRSRQLASVLNYNENELPKIVDISQLSDALQLIENRFHISALFSVFDVLLQIWGTPNAGRLREFVKKHLTVYNGSRKFAQKLKANMNWYCEENGATQLAITLLQSQVKLSDVWAYLELPDHTHSYAYFGAVAMTYVSIKNFRDPGIIEDVVYFVKKHNNDKTARSVLSTLIEGLGIEAPSASRQPLQSYVLQEWENPRIAGDSVRWRDVSDEAKQIFTKWIIKENIYFFFDVVAKACNNIEEFAYRKAFWLTYLKHISFCRLVLRRNTEYLFRDNRYYQEQKWNIATLNNGGSDQHAFIIQMGNHTFVEFSTNAACYVYDNSKLPFRLDAPSYMMSSCVWDMMGDPVGNPLRDQSLAKHRVNHYHSENYYWQEIFESWIKRELEIKPLQSYRLEG